MEPSWRTQSWTVGAARCKTYCKEKFVGGKGDPRQLWHIAPSRYALNYHQGKKEGAGVLICYA